MCAPVHDRVTFKHTCAVNSIGLHCDQVISQEYIIGSLSSAYGQPQAWPYAILSSDLGLLVTVWAGLFTCVGSICLHSTPTFHIPGDPGIGKYTSSRFRATRHTYLGISTLEHLGTTSTWLRASGLNPEVLPPLVSVSRYHPPCTSH